MDRINHVIVINFSSLFFFNLKKEGPVVGGSREESNTVMLRFQAGITKGTVKRFQLLFL